MLKDLKELPKDLRAWLGSDGVISKTKEINKRFGFEGEARRIIPYVISQLMFKGIEPRNFLSEIAGSLRVSQASAIEIVRNIKSEILDPVKEKLDDWGVDLNQLQLAGEFRGQKPVIVASPPPPLPQIAYEPPPQPVMGKIFASEGSSVAPSSAGRGRIHIIGDAHKHTADEKPLSDDSDFVKNSQSIEKTESKTAFPGDEKKIKLPISQSFISGDKAITPEEEDGTETTPFILHKEAVFTPVSKEREWLPPKPPHNIPPPPPVVKKFDSVLNTKVMPKPNKESTQIPKIVNFDEERTAPLKPGQSATVDLKNRSLPPIGPSHSKDMELTKKPTADPKANMVDLR